MLSSLLNKNSLSPNLQMMQQTNKDLMNQISAFEECFSNLSNIKEGDKIGKINNVYYIQSAGMLQKFKRWWNAENRKKTFNDLDEDFSKFFVLGDTIKNNEYYDKELSDLMIKIVNQIIPGLYNLKTTYKECEKGSDGDKLAIKIDSIILTLIDFKQEVNQLASSTPKPTFKIRNLSF